MPTRGRRRRSRKTNRAERGSIGLTSSQAPLLSARSSAIFTLTRCMLFLDGLDPSTSDLHREGGAVFTEVFAR
jgi:hypothetical protein